MDDVRVFVCRHLWHFFVRTISPLSLDLVFLWHMERTYKGGVLFCVIFDIDKNFGDCSNNATFGLSVIMDRGLC